MTITIGVTEKSSRFVPYKTFYHAVYRDGTRYVTFCGEALISGISRAEVADNIRRARAAGCTVVISRKYRKEA